MQPHAAQTFRLNVQFFHLRRDHVRHHRHDFLENFAAFLNEQLVRRVDAFWRGAVQEPEIVADIVRELGLQFGAKNLPMADRCNALFLDKDSCGHVAKDEMAVAIREIQVAGTDFRIHHQHGFRATGPDEVSCGLNAECGRRARHIHVKGKAATPQCVLHFDRHGGIGALHVGRGADNGVNVFGFAARTLQRIARGIYRNLGQYGNAIIRTFGNARCHDVRIQDAGLVDHEARFDAGCLLDELYR